MIRTMRALKVRIQASRLGGERGAAAIEYALIAGVIAVGILGSLAPVRDAVIAVFNSVAAALK